MPDAVRAVRAGTDLDHIRLTEIDQFDNIGRTLAKMTAWTLPNGLHVYVIIGDRELPRHVRAYRARRAAPFSTEVDYDYGAICFVDEDGHLWTGRAPGVLVDPPTIDYDFHGPRRFPPSAIMPFGQVTNVITDFVLTDGDRPASIEWQEPVDEPMR